MLATHREVVAIGYAFSEYDEASYGKLLDALDTRQARVVIVSPEARTIVSRLVSQYPNIEWAPIELGFSAWVEADYPGVDPPTV